MRRSHVEMRSRDIVPPMQNVADDHSAKREVKTKPVREVNAMTAKLAELLKREKSDAM